VLTSPVDRRMAVVAGMTSLDVIIGSGSSGDG
jgi:hypothetical protein